MRHINNEMYAYATKCGYVMCSWPSTYQCNQPTFNETSNQSEKKLVRSSNLLTKINWDIKASDSSHICVKNSENLIKIHIKIVSDLSINVLGGKASDLDQIFGKEQKIFTSVDHYFFAWNYKSNECLTCLLQTNMKPVYFRPISDLAGHQLDFHRSNVSFMKKESQLTSSACGSL